MALIISHNTKSEKPELIFYKIQTESFSIRSADSYPNGWDWMLPKIDWKEYQTIKHYIK